MGKKEWTGRTDDEADEGRANPAPDRHALLDSANLIEQVHLDKLGICLLRECKRISGTVSGIAGKEGRTRISQSSALDGVTLTVVATGRSRSSSIETCSARREREKRSGWIPHMAHAEAGPARGRLAVTPSVSAGWRSWANWGSISTRSSVWGWAWRGCETATGAGLAGRPVHPRQSWTGGASRCASGRKVSWTATDWGACGRARGCEGE